MFVDNEFAPHDVSVILRLIGELPLEVTCVGGSCITPNLADVTVSNLPRSFTCYALFSVADLRKTRKDGVPFDGLARSLRRNDSSQRVFHGVVIGRMTRGLTKRVFCKQLRPESSVN